MRTIITLSSLGLTLALSSAALAKPVERSAFLQPTRSANEQMQNHYRHKKYYRHDQNRARDGASGPARRDQNGIGSARPQVPTPALRPEPAVLREPVGRHRSRIVI